MILDMENPTKLRSIHQRTILQPIRYTWNPVFKRKRDIPASLRVPHIESHHRDNEILSEDDNIIDFMYQFFTATSEESDRTLYQREAMERLCPRISLRDLKLGNNKAQQRLVALVDEKNLSGESSYKGPLTAHQLFQLLTRDV